MELLAVLGRDDLRVVRSLSIPYCHVISKVPVVDTEVVPPQPNSRPIWLRMVFPRWITGRRKFRGCCDLVCLNRLETVSKADSLCLHF